MKNILFSFILVFFSSGAFSGNVRVEGVSIVQLIVNPKAFDNKRIQTNGYVLIHGEGRTQGYWLSLFKEFDIESSIRIAVPEEAPLRQWVEDGHFYTVSGIFKNCDTQSCTLEILFDKERPYIIR